MELRNTTTTDFLTEHSDGDEDTGEIKPAGFIGALDDATFDLAVYQALASMGLWHYNHETNLLQWSDIIFSLFEIDRKQFGASFEAFLAAVHPEDRDQVENAWSQSLENRQPYAIEHRLQMDDGRVKWVLEKCRTTFDSNGRPLHSIGIVQDITGQKEAEARVRENERQFSLFFSQSLHGFFICMLDEPVDWKGAADKDALLEYMLDHHRMTQVNQALLDQYGTTREDFVGITARQLFAHDVGQVRALFRTIYDKGKWHTITHERKPDGTPIVIDAEYIAMHDDQGRVTGHFGVQVDITESHHLEQLKTLTSEVLQILNEPDSVSTACSRVVAAIKAHTRFDAVGMRMEKDGDYPYIAQDGFSEDFLRTENSIVERYGRCGICRDTDGKPKLECTCGLVISGKTDPANPLFTPTGSAYTNDSFPLLDLPPSQDPRHHPRNQCIHHGYASVALIPIRNQERIVGLLQLNDRSKDCFTPESITLFEGVASHIGSALMRKRTEQEVQRAREQYQSLVENIPGVAFRCRHDYGWTMLFISDAIEQVSGYPASDFIKNGVRPFVSVIHPEDVDLVFREIQKAIERGQPWDIEYRLVHRDGTLRWVHEKGCAIYGPDGQIAYLDGFILDLTERKQAQDDRN